MKKIAELNYFDEFIKSSDIIVSSSKVLAETLKNFNEINLCDFISNVHKLENEADQIQHGIQKFLIKDFLPPVDREDISEISRKLDDIEDFIDEALINFNILDIKHIEGNAIQFAELLVESTECVKEIMNELKFFKKKNSINDRIVKVNDIEDRGDRLYEKSIKELYQSSNDPIHVIKWTRIYDCFENTIDACESLSDSISDVLMKNA